MNARKMLACTGIGVRGVLGVPLGRRRYQPSWPSMVTALDRPVPRRARPGPQPPDRAHPGIDGDSREMVNRSPSTTLRSGDSASNSMSCTRWRWSGRWPRSCPATRSPPARDIQPLGCRGRWRAAGWPSRSAPPAQRPGSNASCSSSDGRTNDSCAGLAGPSAPTCLRRRAAGSRSAIQNRFATASTRASSRTAPRCVGGAPFTGSPPAAPHAFDELGGVHLGPGTARQVAPSEKRAGMTTIGRDPPRSSPRLIHS